MYKAVNLVEKEIENIRSKMLLMGGMVVEMIKNSLDGLIKVDDKLLESTFQLEKRVNAAEVEVDDLCNKFLALRAPTASDLRFVLSSLRMIRDLERIGDEAEKMARMAQFFHAHVVSESPKPDLSRMVVDVISMLRRVLDAYARDDDSELKKVIADDLIVDDKFRKILQDMLLRSVNGKQSVASCLDLIFFAKATERIGDHAKNMSESVIFMVKGKDLRHTDPLQ